MMAWTKRWRALRHFAVDKVADGKLMERGSLNLWDNENGLKDRDLGKNVDDQGASSLGSPSEPGMLADVVGRVVSRPAVDSDCESGSKGSLARYTKRDGAIQLLPLLGEALTAVETRARATSERRRHGATMVLEPLREQAQMAVAQEPLREEVRTTQKSRVEANAERWAEPLKQEATMVLWPLWKEALKKVGASGGIGAPCSGTVDGVNEAGGKREMEPLWNEATVDASSRHVLERPLWKEATMTAPADVEGCESELSRSVQCRKGFPREPD